MTGDAVEATLQLRLGPVLAMRQNIRDHAFTFAHPACVEYERLYNLLTDDERTILPLADPEPLPPIAGRSIHPAYAS